MRSFILFLTIVIMSFVTFGQADAQQSQKPTVVLFYADWCGSCKILEPKLKDALKSMDGTRPEMIVFDMTDDKTKAKSADMAAKKGLDAVYKSHAPKTGMAVLVNGQGREVARLKKNQSVDDMRGALSDLMNGQS